MTPVVRVSRINPRLRLLDEAAEEIVSLKSYLPDMSEDDYQDAIAGIANLICEAAA